MANYSNSDFLNRCESNKDRLKKKFLSDLKEDLVERIDKVSNRAYFRSSKSKQKQLRAESMSSKLNKYIQEE